MPYIKLSEYVAKKIYDPDWPIYKINDQPISHYPYVIKVDQFIKRRGKNGLVKTNIKSKEEIDEFIQINNKYSNFILEKQFNIQEENYFCIKFVNGKKEYLFNKNGGINCSNPYENGIISYDLSSFDQKMLPVLQKLDKMFDDIYAQSLEVNPLILDNDYYPIDFAIEIDSTGINFMNNYHRNLIENMQTFDNLSSTEKEIKSLDESSGSSLKFKILNPYGRILTLIAGGGASVLYTDAIVNRGYADELYNYGEYSGNPTEDEVMQYCDLIFKNWFEQNIEERILFIGGGISNFTDVAKTFKGIITSIKKYDFSNVKIWVRRGGVNEKKGLELFKKELSHLNIEIRGTETPITQIVKDALPLKQSDKNNIELPNFSIQNKPKNINLWNDKIVFVGNHIPIIQRIIDYDYYLGKNETDVIAIYDMYSKKDKFQSFYWGNKRIDIPITSNLQLGNYTVSVYNYSSIRTCETVCHKLVNYENIKTFYIIAEGLPERKAIELSNFLSSHGKTLLGPSSVGAIKAGPDGKRIGSVGGLIDNIKRCNLSSNGYVAIITKSGGLLNEMINYVSQLGLLIAEAVSIGGDRYPGITFSDLLEYYSNQNHIKVVIMLGETGGFGEIEGLCSKPVIAWCSGTSEKSFGENVEFGHAGASANSQFEEATSKNYIMHKKEFFVPKTFEDIGETILMFKSTIKTTNNERTVPQDINDAINNGLIRLNPTFRTNICDERTELKYRGEYVENIVENNYSIGYTIASLWLNIKPQEWTSKFIEKIITLMADHGPAVSGSHNTIITARAGKNLTESITSGILTIGPRFGGAVSGAALDFFEAYLNNENPENFVERMKNEGKVIMGIGHKIKSKFNPDKRVEIIKNMITNTFPQYNVLKYALLVEKETLKKKTNLILNVDGAIGAALIDILLNYKSIPEIKNIIKTDLLNGFFVFARTIGLIGHYQEQKINDYGLYRVPNWDIEYN